MTTLHDRYELEKGKWDEIAERHLDDIALLEPAQDFHAYTADDILLEGIPGFLGDLRGKQVLEIGCGEGLLSVLLAKSGARVVSFDISHISMVVAKRRADVNGVEIFPLVSAGEFLPFPPDSFDIVFGTAILHHLDPRVGGGEIYRVLRKGGKAAFSEPMGMNPVLTFVRQHVHYKYKNPVGVDRPLTYQDMDTWTQNFQHREYHEAQLLSMIERGFGWEHQFKLLRKMDAHLLKHNPFLRRFCRYVVILATK